MQNSDVPRGALFLTYKYLKMKTALRAEELKIDRLDCLLTSVRSALPFTLVQVEVFGFLESRR